jgi:hypothetical protein
MPRPKNNYRDWTLVTLTEGSEILNKIGGKPGLYQIKISGTDILYKKDASDQPKVASSYKTGSQAGEVLAKGGNREFQGRDWAGPFNRASVENVAENAAGIYVISSPRALSDPKETLYVGKSDSCIQGRLKKHLRSSSNQSLRKAVSSGEELLFYCWESPDPKYEEALEIKRLKQVGRLAGQRNERKPLIEYLD